MLAPCLFLCQEAAPTTATEFLWEGHVRDAFTGAPLEGVRFEFWSESMGGEAELVASVHSDASGRCAQSVPRERAEKLRLQKPGYRSTLTTPSDDEFVLFPAREPFELRILELDGRPLAGARVQIRQTCRHAPPTTLAFSDAAGTAALADLPPFRDGGELEILAPGHGALGGLEPADLSPAANVYLPRRPPIELRLLDESGRAVARGTCRYDGEVGGYPLALDPTGRATIDALFDDATGAVQHGSFGLDLPPAGDEWCLRFGDWKAAEGAAELTLELAGGGERPAGLRVSVLHDEGWLLDGLGKRALPPGGLRVVLGAPFSGFAQEITRLVLGTGEARSLTLAPQREPELALELPEGHWIVHVQAGEDSVTRTSNGKKPLRTGVPAGRAVVVLAQGEEVRRARLEPWSGVKTLDLGAPECLLEPSRHSGAPAELRFRVRSAGGAAVGAEATLRTVGPERADEDPSPEGVLFHVPANARWEARFAAEGHVSLWRSGVSVEGGAAFEELVLPVHEGD